MTSRQSDSSPRVRALIGVLGRLVIFVIAFQMVAIDHWHASPEDIVGLENSQTHVLHCHGGSAGCADSASGLTVTLDNVSLTPPAPLTIQLDTESDLAAPRTVFISSVDRPPRTA